MNDSSRPDKDRRPEDNRFSEFFCLSEREQEALAKLPGPIQTFPRQHVLRREGDEPAFVYLLLEGWVAASVALSSGKQQTVKIHLPKDLMGAPSLCLVRSVESLTAITPVAVRAIARSDLMSMFGRFPRVAASLFLSAQKERVALMGNLAIAGQTEGLPRIAGVLVDLYDRLSALGLSTGTRMPFPLTQQQIGELVGLSHVQVNRVLRRLDQVGLIERGVGFVALLDVDRLRAMSGLPEHVFQRNPDWVQLT